ncbi:hypothetical protein F5Y17DRAFT_455825 [Xylariaceae sp. FL0594]|nr:hypothetical protein F5Y17DRAFT_455825 [Xylariaceae sp. FL0594]
MNTSWITSWASPSSAWLAGAWTLPRPPAAASGVVPVTFGGAILNSTPTFPPLISPLTTFVTSPLPVPTLPPISDRIPTGISIPRVVNTPGVISVGTGSAGSAPSVAVAGFVTVTLSDG